MRHKTGRAPVARLTVAGLMQGGGLTVVERPTLATLTGMTVGSYILDELVRSSELDALYLAHRQGDSGVYRIRLLITDAAQRSDSRSTWQSRFERQARQLAALQHPYLLPLVDFGVARGVPYLVWPHLPVRPLSVRLAQSGPLDPITAGRYLDQIAAVLEYARERDVLHLNLSAACLFIQRDGRLLVGDLGVRPLIELGRSDAEQYAFDDPGEACAPEQLLHQPVDGATDVYALGELIFEMLAGQPLFDSPSRQLIAQQHLRGAIPFLSTVRHDLPPDIDDLVTRALARNRRERYLSAGALANAYNMLVAPNNAARVPFTPATATPVNRLTGQTPVATPIHTFDAPGNEIGAATQQRTNIGLIALVAVLLVALVGGGFAYFAIQHSSAPPATTAQITFDDAAGTAPGHSNGVHITLSNAAAPPSGSHYVLWLIDDQHEIVYNLGSLVQQGNTYTLTASGPQAQGGNLLALGDRLEVTQEKSATTAPLGAILVSGAFPPQAFVHIGHLLVSFPTTPAKTGLLVGLLNQTRLLATQGQVLTATANSSARISCLAQSILDIVEGAQGADSHPLVAPCAALGVTATGDGFGLAAPSPTGSASNYASKSGYLSDAADHASLAASQSDATATIRHYASQVGICIVNLQQWTQQLIVEARALLAQPTKSALAQSAAQLAAKIYAGTDANHDGQVDAVSGEGGALQAYQSGQLMASLTLTHTTSAA